MRSSAVLSSRMPPSTASSASRLCGGTRRRLSSIVAIPTPQPKVAGLPSPAEPTQEPPRKRSSTSWHAEPDSCEKSRATSREHSCAAERDLRTQVSLLQEPVESLAVVPGEPLRREPAGRRRLEHEHAPEHHPGGRPRREKQQRLDER